MLARWMMRGPTQSAWLRRFDRLMAEWGKLEIEEAPGLSRGLFYLCAGDVGCADDAARCQGMMMLRSRASWKTVGMR